MSVPMEEAAGKSADWRDDCVKPVKDNRVQTEVGSIDGAVCHCLSCASRM